MGQINCCYRHCVGNRKIYSNKHKKSYKLKPIDIEFINEGYVESPKKIELNFI